MEYLVLKFVLWGNSKEILHLISRAKDLAAVWHLFQITTICSNTTYYLFYLNKVIQTFLNCTLLNFGLKHHSYNFLFRYTEDSEAHFQFSMHQKAW